MKRRRHGTEEIIRKWREAEILEGQGQTLAQVCQKLEISEQALHRWRKRFRGTGDDDVRRLKESEEEIGLMRLTTMRRGSCGGEFMCWV